MRSAVFLASLLIASAVSAAHPDAWKYDIAAAQQRKEQKTEGTYFVKEIYSQGSEEWTGPTRGKDTMRFERYDREGRIILEYDRRKENDRWTHFWYNNNAQIVRALFYKVDSSNCVYSEYYYDERGNMKQEVEYKIVDGALSMNYIGYYKFDELNRVVDVEAHESIYQPGMALLVRSEKYTYKGNTIIHKTYDHMVKDYTWLDTTWISRGHSFRREYYCSTDPATGALIAEQPDTYRRDTVANGETVTIVFEYSGYSYTRQAIVQFEFDSLITDAWGKPIERYSNYNGPLFVSTYTYPPAGPLELVSQPDHDPLYRVQELRSYYQ